MLYSGDSVLGILLDNDHSALGTLHRTSSYFFLCLLVCFFLTCFATFVFLFSLFASFTARLCSLRASLIASLFPCSVPFHSLSLLLSLSSSLLLALTSELCNLQAKII